MKSCLDHISNKNTTQKRFKPYISIPKHFHYTLQGKCNLMVVKRKGAGAKQTRYKERQKMKELNDCSSISDMSSVDNDFTMIDIATPLCIGKFKDSDLRDIACDKVTLFEKEHLKKTNFSDKLTFVTSRKKLPIRKVNSDIRDFVRWNKKVHDIYNPVFSSDEDYEPSFEDSPIKTTNTINKGMRRFFEYSEKVIKTHKKLIGNKKKTNKKLITSGYVKLFDHKTSIKKPKTNTFKFSKHHYKCDFQSKKNKMKKGLFSASTKHLAKKESVPQIKISLKEYSMNGRVFGISQNELFRKKTQKMTDETRGSIRKKIDTWFMGRETKKAYLFEKPKRKQIFTGFNV